MDLNQILAYVQTVEAVAKQALAQANAVGNALPSIGIIQTGNGQLINGSIAIILGPGKINSNSHIVATIRSPLAGGGNLVGVVGLAVPDVSRNFATGAFLVQAIDSAGFAVGTAQASFDYIVVNTN